MPPKKSKNLKEKTLQRSYSLVAVGDWLINHLIWVPRFNDEVDPYETGLVQGYTDHDITCNVNGENQSFAILQCRNSNGAFDALEVNDVSRLNHVNDAAVLDFLKQRYISNVIYTYAGRLLVAINPFCLLPGLYGADVIATYKQAGEAFTYPSDLRPHTYAVAQKAVSLFYGKHENQSCIVSGESGSGKTETARQLMEFFSSSGDINATEKQNKIQDIILGSNPLLESFGNAKTLRNNNSSRFGRFVKLALRHGGQGIQAGEISQYMLELSRIDTQQKGERNYHIFYQLCTALPEHLKTACKIRQPDYYNFLNKSGVYTVETVDDIAEHKEVNEVLGSLMSTSVIESLYKALSGVLLCGNVTFENVAKGGTEQAAAVKNPEILIDIGDLLGISSTELEHSLTIKQTEVRGQLIESPLTSTQALNVASTLAKDAYSAIFDWLVVSINSRCINEATGGALDRWIGILDIYGFEFFENNSLEQFLINYANEKLQQFFIQNEEECQAEGIDYSAISYEDNAVVIELIDNKRSSILALLEEQSQLGSGTSEKFTASCHTVFETKYPEIYIKPKLNAQTQFRINHTAAPVMYSTIEFVSKNKLKMPPSLTLMLRSSSNNALNDAFKLIEAVRTQSMKGQFAGSKFAASMDKLMTLLQTSNAHFIRCIKPNDKKQKGSYVSGYVLNQLQSLSILDAVALVLKGFAYRAPYADFVREHQLLAYLTAHKEINEKDESVNITKVVLTRLNIPQDQWQLGHTRVFIRKEGRQLLDRHFKIAMNTIQPLILRIQGIHQSSELRNAHGRKAVAILWLQHTLRRHSKEREEIQKRKTTDFLFGVSLLFNVLISRQHRNAAATVIQKHFRGHLVRRRYEKQLRSVRTQKFHDTVRKWARGFKASRRLKAVVQSIRSRRAARTIQRVWRGYKARKFYKPYKRWKQINAAATRIQALFKGYRVRRDCAIMDWIADCATTIQKIWRGYRIRTGPIGRAIRRRVRVAKLRMEYFRVKLQLQSLARTYLVLTRLEELIQSALTLQAAALRIVSRSQFNAIRTATLILQSWWRGDRVRRIIREEKLRIVMLSTAADAQEVNQNEHEIAEQLLKSALRQQHKRQKEKSDAKERKVGLYPLHISVFLEPKTTYPIGWIAGLSTFINSAQLKCGRNNHILTVSCGAFHTILLTSNGAVYSYGLNDKGQLGLGTLSIKGVATPSKLPSLRSDVYIKQVSCGADHTLALAENGVVYAWGDNSRCQCGSKAQEKFLIPITVPFKNVSSRANHKVDYVSAGSFHNAAISQGMLWIWGRNDHLCLSKICNDVPVPRRVITKEKNIMHVQCGLAATLLLTESGDVLVFGDSSYGLLGLGFGRQKPRKPKKIRELHNVKDISIGVNFALAVTSSGEVWQWGLILEWDPCINQSTKVSICKPMKVEGLTGVVECHAGWWDVVARTETKQLVGWTIFKYCGQNVLKPQLYTFDLASKAKILSRRAHIACCPLFSAVLCEPEAS